MIMQYRLIFREEHYVIKLLFPGGILSHVPSLHVFLINTSMTAYIYIFISVTILYL